MMTIFVTDTEGERKEVDIRDGWSLMEVLRDAGYDDILAMCGGVCSCATCHVHIDNQVDHDLPVVEEDEEMLLMAADGYDAKKSRLSCQVSLDASMAGLQVKLVPEE